MAKVEIDEAEFMRLSKLNNFAHSMLQNEDSAKLLEQAAKIVDPNAKTPRLDRAAQAAAPVKTLEQKFDDYVKAQEAERATNQTNQTLLALKTQRDDGMASLRRQGWTDEGIKGVETLMETKGILDPLDAAAIFEKNHPPMAPMLPGGTGGWGFMEQMQDDSDADLKKLIETKGDQDAVTDHIARKALNEVRQSQVRR